MEREYYVVCGGCGNGSTVKWPAGYDKELVESVQASPPFCIVCATRALSSPRQGATVWEPITGKTEEVAAPAALDFVI